MPEPNAPQYGAVEITCGAGRRGDLFLQPIFPAGMTLSKMFNPGDGWELQADKGFVGLVGPFWQRDRGGKTEYAFFAEPRHANLLDVVQGGMIMTFADRALGLEAWKAAGNRACSTIQFGTQFVASAPIGAFVTLEPQLTRMTRSMVFMEGKVMAGERLAASVQGIWKILGA